MTKHVFTLYVTGRTQRTEGAIRNLKRVCEEELGGDYELQVIDVLERPQDAEQRKILATPTLVKELPPPLRRMIGDLSDKETLIRGLDLHLDESGPRETGGA